MGFFFWRFAHAACIEYHQVGLFHAALFPTQLFEDGLDALRVSLVHLAANGPDVVFPTRNTGGRGHSLRPSPSIGYLSRIRVSLSSCVPHAFKSRYYSTR